GGQQVTPGNDGMRRAAIGASSSMKRGAARPDRAPRQSRRQTHAERPATGRRRTMTEITEVTEHNAPEGAATPSKAEWITSAAAAHLLGLTPDSLRSYRCRGEGPPFQKFGQAVVYSRSEVEAFAAARAEG